MSEAYARRGARVTGVDPSAVSLKVARAHARESGLSIRYQRKPGARSGMLNRQPTPTSECYSSRISKVTDPKLFQYNQGRSLA